VPLKFFEEFIALRTKYGARVAAKRRFELWRNRYLFASTEESVLKDLCRLGVQAGDLVLVHSSFSRVGYLRGGPQAFIAALKKAVGPDGAIMMPAFPHLGGTFEYVQTAGVFDVGSTPAAVGQLQEAFRTTAGTLRSIHPTHSYCAWGKGSAEIVRDHHLSVRPFGHGTPLYRFIERSGKTLLLGVGLKNFSPPRVIEDVMDYPHPVYAEELYELPVRDYEGREFTVKTYVHSEELAPLRRTDVFYEPLKSLGKVQEGKVGLAPAMYIDCSGLLDLLRDLTEKGITPYTYRRSAAGHDG
jgi:aminoglycoside 3-N-acetyltransferase